MGSPYLNSGETIILTTTRVIADDVQYDVMLTTERIVFIDYTNPRFDPEIVMLSTILSIQSGKTPANEPVITILFCQKETGDTRPPLSLLFSQYQNENRKEERDDWVRNLIKLTIRQHEREIERDIPVVRHPAGLRPVIRHGPAPEMVRPHSDVINRRNIPAPVAVIPEENYDVIRTVPFDTDGEEPVREERKKPVRKLRIIDYMPEREPVKADTIPGEPGWPEPEPVQIPQIADEPVPENTIPPEESDWEKPEPVQIPQIADEPVPENTIPTEESDWEEPEPVQIPQIADEPVPENTIPPEESDWEEPEPVPIPQMTEEPVPENPILPEESVIPEPEPVLIPQIAEEPVPANTILSEEPGIQEPEPVLIPQIAEEPVPANTILSEEPGIQEPAPVRIPQIIEEPVPGTSTPVEPGRQEPEVPVVIDQEFLFRTIPRVPRIMKVKEMPTPEDARDTGTVAMPESSPVADTPIETGMVTIPGITEPGVIPDIIRALQSGPSEPFIQDTSEIAGPGLLTEPETTEHGIPDSLPESAYEIPVIPEPDMSDNVTEPVYDIPVSPEPNISDTVTDSVYETPATPEPDIQDTVPVSVYQTPVSPGPETQVVEIPYSLPEPAYEIPVMSAPEIPDTIPESVTGIPTSPEQEIPDAIPQPSCEIPATESKEVPVPEALPDITGDDMQEHPMGPGNAGVLPQGSGTPQTPPARHPIPPAREIRPFRRTLAYFAVIIVIIALAGAGLLLMLPHGPEFADNPVTPVPTGDLNGITSPAPASGALPDSVIPSPTIPQEGVWVRVNSMAGYNGSLGNTGMLRQVSGTGDQFYPIFWSDHVVLVSIRKTDNSGGMLTATVYRNGTVIGTRSVTAPMGRVEILIDPRTASAPGLPVMVNETVTG